jgi:hypothetical protein
MAPLSPFGGHGEGFPGRGRAQRALAANRCLWPALLQSRDRLTPRAQVLAGVFSYGATKVRAMPAKPLPAALKLGTKILAA